VYGISGYFHERSTIEKAEPVTAEPDFHIPESTVLLGYGGLDERVIQEGCRLLRIAWSNSRENDGQP